MLVPVLSKGLDCRLLRSICGAKCYAGVSVSFFYGAFLLLFLFRRHARLSDTDIRTYVRTYVLLEGTATEQRSNIIDETMSILKMNYLVYG